jgi:hypothetical protein
MTGCVLRPLHAHDTARCDAWPPAAARHNVRFLTRIVSIGPNETMREARLPAEFSREMPAATRGPLPLGSICGPRFTREATWPFTWATPHVAETSRIIPSQTAYPRRHAQRVKESDMNAFPEHMAQYRAQLKKGGVQQAYRGLMQYMMALRVHFEKKYADAFVSASLYQGYMDMTYFAFTPISLVRRRLKVAIVFKHEAFRFEAWLAGSNRKIQARYWKIFKESNWNKYRVVPSITGVDAIVECVLAEDPAFGDLDALTRRIEAGTLRFIKDVEQFLSRLPN